MPAPTTMWPNRFILKKCWRDCGQCFAARLAMPRANSPAVLIATGIALSTLYRHAVERAFDRRLDVYLRTLVADVASPEDSGEKFPQSIGEPLFELPLSGWYWQVARLDSKTPDVHSSRSLWD